MAGGTGGQQAIEIFQPEFIEFGGEERVILSLARRLHERGLTPQILCYHNQIGLERYADFPVSVHALEPGAGIQSKARRLAAHLGARHQSGAPVPMLCNIQSAYHAGLAVRSPYHLRIPDTFRLLGPPMPGPKQAVRRGVIGYFAGRGIRRAATFSTNTRALADEMEALYRRRGEVLYLGGMVQAAPAPKPVTGAVRALSVSRVQSSKRIDWMIDAMADLAVQRPDLPRWELDIAGKGPELDALRVRAAERGVADRVHFLGFVSDAELHALYAAAHLFLMPAIQGYGIPAIEALDRRLAVVLTTDSGVCEILADTRWATVTAPDRAAFTAGLAETLVRVARTDLLAGPMFPTPKEPQWADAVIALSRWTR